MKIAGLISTAVEFGCPPIADEVRRMQDTDTVASARELAQSESSPAWQSSLERWAANVEARLTQPNATRCVQAQPKRRELSRHSSQLAETPARGQVARKSTVEAVFFAEGWEEFQRRGERELAVAACEERGERISIRARRGSARARVLASASENKATKGGLETSRCDQ